MKTTDGKNVKKRLKLWLLSEKTITHNQAQKMWGTNRLSEFIRRLRHDDNMNISMKMVYEGKDSYGVYSWVKEKKVSRIVSGTYSRV